MSKKVVVYDPTISDEKSRVRGVGRYLQILKENFPQWQFFNKIEILKEKNIDVFINPFFNFFQKPLFLNKVAKKQIAVIHDLIPLKFPQHFPIGIKGKFFYFFNRLFLKNYDLIVTDSYASKRDIVKILGIEENKIEVIYPCLPKIFSNFKFQISNSKFQIPNYKLQIPNSKFQTPNSKFQTPNSNFCLYVGDATWNKNLVNLAKAIKIINVSCVFVGKVFQNLSSQNLTHPWQKSFKEFFSLSKDDKRFIFLGYIDDYDLVWLYQQARANLLVSYDEGFGFSYLEAASQKCPSIISQINVLKEISDKQGVLFVDSDNPNEIANQIGELYFNQNLRDQMGNQAFERAKFFSPKKFIDQFIKITD